MSRFAIIFLVAFFCFCLPQGAQAEAIRSFDVDIRTFRDASFLVTETIDYDFGEAQRHGIHRIIPILYTKNNNDYKIELRLLNVADKSGAPYEVQKVISGQKVNFRIGSRTDTMTGDRIITVQYLVRNGVNFFDGTPEIYWNVTGHDWPVPIARVSCTIHPPKGVLTENIKFDSFGVSNGKKFPGNTNIGDEGIIFEFGLVKPGNHFTIIAGFPEGAMIRPGFKMQMLWWLEDWWPAIVVPLFSAFALGAIYWQFGRDPKDTHFDQEPRFTPPLELSPAEVGTLIDEKCDMHDIVATVLDLAVRGHLTIKQLSKDDPYGFSGPSIQFVRQENSDDTLTKFEKMFLSGIFAGDLDSVFLTDLKYNFQRNIAEIKQEIYKGLVEKGYFQTNPHEERFIYYSLAIILVIVGSVLLMVGQEVESAMGWAIGLLLASAMAAAVAPYMPSKTKLGCKTVAKILSFVRFLKVASFEDIEKLSAEDRKLFGKLLPYTIVLGLEDRWARVFAEILDEPPVWFEPLEYYGAKDKKFDAKELVVGIGACVRTMQSDLIAVSPPPPSSFSPAINTTGSSGFGGGGFSGGGSN